VCLGYCEDVMTEDKGNCVSCEYQVEPKGVEENNDQHNDHRLSLYCMMNTPSVQVEVSPHLNLWRSEPRASFNKSFRKANEMLRVSGRTQSS